MARHSKMISAGGNLFSELAMAIRWSFSGKALLNG